MFRYIGRDEYAIVKGNHLIWSVNVQGTYWTTLLTDDGHAAKRFLSLRQLPSYRVGGFPLKDVDIRAVRGRGIVSPRYGEPGGGDYILLDKPLPIVSIFEFESGTTRDSYLKEL